MLKNLTIFLTCVAKDRYHSFRFKAKKAFSTSFTMYRKSKQEMIVPVPHLYTNVSFSKYLLIIISSEHNNDYGR